MSAVVPLLLFTLPSARKRPGLLATGAFLAVGGFILQPGRRRAASPTSR